MIELLIDPQPPEGFEVVTTETVPGLPADNAPRRSHIQAFNRVWKGKIPVTQTARHFHRCFEMILRVRTFLFSFRLHHLFTRLCILNVQSVFFKLRKTTPCVITNLQFGIDLPESDEIQITVFGNYHCLAEHSSLPPQKKSFLPDACSR